MARSGIAVGLNKGRVTTPIENSKERPSRTKGVSLFRKVMVESATLIEAGFD
jgi:hypothetical protein